MFDASGFLGFFGVVPAVQRTDEVAGDAAQTFEFAFVKMFGVGVEIFLGGFLVGFFGDELSAGLDETRNVQDVIIFEIGERFFGVLFGNFSVFFE